jgi:hypothetical protein
MLRDSAGPDFVRRNDQPVRRETVARFHEGVLAHGIVNDRQFGPVRDVQDALDEILFRVIDDIAAAMIHGKLCVRSVTGCPDHCCS